MYKFKKILSVVISLIITVSVLVMVPINNITVFATQQRYYNFSKNFSLTGNGATDMLAVAFAQVGKSKADFGYSEAWCADFVCDCAYLANQTSAIPLSGAVSSQTTKWSGLLELVLKAGGTKTSNPQPGDLVFWKNPNTSHVEIVSKVVNGETYSIGGNNTVKSASGNYNGCAGERKCTDIDNNILCYVRPNYSGDPPPPQPDPTPGLVTPTISTDKSSYNVGDTVYLSWAASPSDSNLSHYWLNVIAPDGTWIHGGTMNKETSYSFVASQPGDYSITTYATPIGSLEGEGSLSDSKTISVKSRNPVFNASATYVNINMDKNEEKYIEFSYSDYSGPINIRFDHGSNNNTVTNLKWGEWNNNKVKLYISGCRTGSEVFTVTFEDNNTFEKLHTFDIYVTVTGEFRVTPDKDNCTLNLEKKQDADITFYCYNVPSEGL